MPPKIDLTPFRADIVEWTSHGLNSHQMLENLSAKGIRCSAPCLNSFIRGQGLRPPRVLRDRQAVDKRAVRNLVSHYDWDLNLTDDQILQRLQRDGYQHFTQPSIVKLRKEAGMYRDLDSGQKAVGIVKIINEHLTNGTFQRFGLARAYQVIMEQSKLSMSQTAFRWYVKSVAPEIVRPESESRAGRRNSCKAPNSIWSTEGYSELERYGIEVYSAVDVFTRYILWTHIGPSACTDISVAKQYINAVAHHGVIPDIVRSAARSKTVVIMSNFHLHLRRAEQAYQLRDVFKDRKAEPSWSKRARNLGFEPWLTYFERLEAEGGFHNTSEIDKMCVRFVYIPILRVHMNRFMGWWNQQDGGHGQPNSLWLQHGTNACEHPPQKPDPERLRACQSALETYDDEEFLPRETMEWLGTQLNAGGFADVLSRPWEQQPSGGPHREAYLFLRERAGQHAASGQMPRLRMLPRLEASSEALTGFPLASL